MIRWRAHILALFGLLGVAGCSGSGNGGPETAIFHTEQNPTQLSDWGVLKIERGHLVAGEDSTIYGVRAPLFTDYAHKMRTVHTPEPAAIRDDGSLDFAVGTIISKTFYYPDNEAGQVVLAPDETAKGIDLNTHRVLETRLLVRRDAGWEPVSYVWNDDESGATLKRTGAVRPLTLVGDDIEPTDFAYVVPNENQCAGCHATNSKSDALFPLGAIAPQFTDRSAMIVAGVMRPGVFTAQIDYRNAGESLEERARSYLDSNCAHCHNPVGPADTSGLDLSLSAETALVLGACKPPIAAGSGTGGYKFSIVPGQPDRSIMPYRMASTDPGAMMPELGRSLAHAEGVELVRDWIASMDGSCES